ncbi:MAG: ribonuclease [Clostridia bacterium]|nr:ribonuclease [Clostridia bacterium]
MKRKPIFALISLLLAAVLLFSACAPDAGFDLLADTDDPTSGVAADEAADLTEDNTPAETRANAPPETQDEEDDPASADGQDAAPIDEDGSYTSKEDVALYIHTYGKLPGNFITKSQAEKLGWSGGGLDKYAPGKCIGGGRFGNYEGLLPDKQGRVYTECDIDTLGAKSRGAKRIVFSNDGLIYYTDDHYESFTLLYGEE